MFIFEDDKEHKTDTITKANPIDSAPKFPLCLQSPTSVNTMQRKRNRLPDKLKTLVTPDVQTQTRKKPNSRSPRRTFSTSYIVQNGLNQVVQRMDAMDTGDEVDLKHKEKIATKLKAQKPDRLSDMGKILETKIKRKVGLTSFSRPQNLSSIGEALLFEISDDPAMATDLYESVDAQAKVLAEVSAVAEYLEGKARVGGGGGLFQKQPDKRWAMDSPLHSPTTSKAIHDERAQQPGWRSPTHYPSHGGAAAPTLLTPGGTELIHYATYAYQSSRSGEQRTHMYGSNVMAREPQLAPTNPLSSPSGTLTKHIENYKRVQSPEINESLLNRWAGKRKGFSPDQNTAMNNTSANQAAGASGYPTDAMSWQWLHLIAFTLGGSKDETHPNTKSNLVAGTAAANGFHLVIENLVKKIVLTKIFEVVEISAVAHMISGTYHMAHKIVYLFKCKNKSDSNWKFSREYTINPLDPNQSAGGDLAFLWAEFVQLSEK